MTLTAIRVFAVVLHLFQKVPEHINGQNQNPQRPNVFGRGYPSPPPVASRRFRIVHVQLDHAALSGCTRVVVDHHGIRSVCVPGCVGLLVCVPRFDMPVNVS